MFSAKGSRRPVPGFRLYGVTARRLVADGGLEGRLETLCALGLRGVQLREKDLSETDLIRLSANCRPIFERHGTTWLVNSSIRSAEVNDANGVHIGASCSVSAARESLGDRALVGKSVHDLAEAHQAAAEEADFIVFGPIFATPEKEGFGPPQGLDRLREVCGQSKIPVFAVGGVTPPRAQDCREAGAYGVAVMSALMVYPKPEKLLADYGAALGSL